MLLFAWFLSLRQHFWSVFKQIFIVQKILLTLELWRDVDLILFCGAASANSLQEMLLALYANSTQEILLALCVNSSSQYFTPR